MPSPREKAARRAEEIEELLENDALPADKRKALEGELGAIADNIAEGCYSNDPDDGIDWSTCPGISIAVNPKIVTGPENVKFYCPEMKYRLLSRNDEGKTVSSDRIPEDLLDLYQYDVKAALEKAYFFSLKHPNATLVTAGAEVSFGTMYGTIDVSLKSGLTQDSLDALRDELTGQLKTWSSYFEGQQIDTDGGDLYIQFYNGGEPLLTDTAFTNRMYIKNCLTVPDVTKFYADEDCDYIRMMYYNPDSSHGGQLVDNYLYLGMLEEALDECETDKDFWERVEGCACQYLIDIDTPEFIAEARALVELPCDFNGQNRSTIDWIRNWVAQQQGEDQSPEMNM